MKLGLGVRADRRPRASFRVFRYLNPRAVLLFVPVAVAMPLLLFAGCDTKSVVAPAPPPPSGPQVSIVLNASTLTTTAYSPSLVTVTVGSTVTWTNNDTTVHSAFATNATAPSLSFNTGNIQPGGTANVSFPTKGSFVYHCAFHPGMVGTINVN